MAEPYDMGGVPAAPPPPADPTQNKGLIIAALVGVNILCLVAASAASLLLPRPGAHAATATTTTEKSTAASATPTAEAKATAEPTAAAAAKDDTQEAASAAPSASAAADAPATGGGTRAVVTPPKNGPKAVVRGKPDAKSPLIVILPAGTAVEVTDKTTINKQVWYQVKTVDFTPPSTGWMHGNNLKMD